MCNIVEDFQEKPDFKIFFKPTKDEKQLEISGYLPSKVISDHYGFEDLYLKFEDMEKKFTVQYERIPGYSFIEPGVFDLNPSITLGNVVRVYASALGHRYTLGECHIALVRPQYNETEHMIEDYELARE